MVRPVQRGYVGSHTGDLAAERFDEGTEPGADGRVVDDALVRNMKRAHSLGMRLDRADARAFHPPQSGEPVGLPSPVQLAEASALQLIGGDHELAAPLVSDSVFLTERHHFANA